MTIDGLVIIAGLLVLVLIVPAMLLSPQGRLMAFVLGTLATAGSSAGVTTLELAFVGFLIPLTIAAFVSVNRRIRSVNPEEANILRSVRNGAMLSLIATMVGVCVGIFNHGSLLDATRASVSYFSITVAVLCGLDCWDEVRRSFVSGLATVVSVVSATSFMLFYSHARGVTAAESVGPLPILPSMVLAGLGVALGVTQLAENRARLVTSVIRLLYPIAALLASGTRTGLVLIVAFASGLSRKRNGDSPALVLALSLLLGGLVMFPMLNLVSRLTGTTDFASERLRSIREVITMGISSDASGESRVIRYRVAWDAFMDSPTVGRGLGAQYFDGVRHLYYLDTPLMYLATFGIAGFVLIGVGIAFICRGLWRGTNLKDVRDSQAKRLLIGVGAVVMALSPFSVVLEDRGLAVTIALLLAFTFGRQDFAQREKFIRSQSLNGK